MNNFQFYFFSTTILIWMVIIYFQLRRIIEYLDQSKFFRNAINFLNSCEQQKLWHNEFKMEQFCFLDKIHKELVKLNNKENK